MASATLKAAAARYGITLGVGPVDTSGSVHWFDMGYGVGIDYDFARPHALDPATDPDTELIVNEFGGALDLCLWAVGNTDLSHYGQQARWTAPGVYNFTGCDEAYAFALARGMRVWISDPAYSGTPTWIVNGGFTPAQLTEMLHGWYTAAYSRYPAAYATTLLNEFLPFAYDKTTGASAANAGASVDWWYRNTDIGLLAGRSRLQFLDTVYRWVRAIVPGVKLVLNFPNAEGVDDISKAHAAAALNWARDVIDQGTPIDGVGLQSHFWDSTVAYDTAGYTQTIRDFHALGIEVAITEFDLNHTDASWASRAGALVSAVLDAGCVRDFTFWSIRDPLYYWDAEQNPAIGAPYTQAFASTAERDAILAAFDAPVPLRVNADAPVGGTVRLWGTAPEGATITVSYPPAPWSAIGLPRVSLDAPAATASSSAGGIALVSAAVSDPPTIAAVTPASVAVGGSFTVSLLKPAVTVPVPAASATASAGGISAGVAASEPPTITGVSPSTVTVGTPFTVSLSTQSSAPTITGIAPASVNVGESFTISLAA